MIALRFAASISLVYRSSLVGAFFLVTAFTVAEDISLERWIEAAIERDPEVAEARVESVWQTSRVDSLDVWEDPEVRFGRERREDRAYQSSFRVRVPIPHPWEVQAEKAEIEARADAEYLRMEAVAWERSIALASRYYEAVFAQRLLEIRSQLMEGLDKDLGAAEVGFEARAITRSRLIDMRAERAIASTRLAKDKVEWITLREEIRSRAGWSDVRVTALSTPLPSPETLDELPQLADLRTFAFREEGELGALTAEQREEEARVEGRQSQSIPWITFLEGTWLRESARGREDFEARVAVTLPVFSWLKQSQTEEALRLIRSRDRISAFTTALESALESAWYGAEAQTDRLQSVYKETQASLDEIEAALLVRGLDPRTMSGLRDLWVDLQKERLDAALDYQMSLLDLMSVSGPGYPVKGLQIRLDP